MDIVYGDKNKVEQKNLLAENRKKCFKDLANNIHKGNSKNRFALLKRISGYKGMAASGGIVTSIIDEYGTEQYNEEKDKVIAKQFMKCHGGDDTPVPSEQERCMECKEFPEIPLSYP